MIEPAVFQEAILWNHPQHHRYNNAEAANAYHYRVKHVIITDDIEVHIGVEIAIDIFYLCIIGDGKFYLAAGPLNPKMIAPINYKMHCYHGIGDRALAEITTMGSCGQRPKNRLAA